MILQWKLINTIIQPTWVSRKVDMKVNSACDEAGVRSGNSGRQNTTQACISGKVNSPRSTKVL